MGSLAHFILIECQWDYDQRDGLLAVHVRALNFLASNLINHPSCYRSLSKSHGFVSHFQASVRSLAKDVSPNASAGIIACWVVQCVFSQAIGSYWGPVLYSIFATLLEGIICLGTCVVAEGVRTYSPCAGMIYDMDPYRMPKTFCIRECQSVSLDHG